MKLHLSYIFQGPATLAELCEDKRVCELVTKKNKVMEWKGGEPRESTQRKQGGCIVWSPPPHLGPKWQRQPVSGIVLLKDLSPSSHLARPAWQRSFCPFSYNDNTFISETMHDRAVVGSDLHYKRSLMQQVRVGHAGLIAARTQALFSCM